MPETLIMDTPEADRRTNLMLIGFFVAALVAHAWWTTANWRSGFMPGHEFRQTQTAIITYYIDRQDDFSLLYETPIVGKPWVSILMEVPIYEWSVVGVSRTAHIPQHVAARTVTLSCFYLTLPALYLLLGRMQLAPARRLLALGLILVCPLYIFYSRAFLMDSMALMFCAWFLHGFVQMMDRRRWYWFLLAAAAGVGAALVKSAVFAVWLLPAAAYGAWLLWSELRKRTWGPALETVFWGVAGVIVPLGALRWWIVLTDPIKESHASAGIFTSKNLAVGNWGLTNLVARFSGSTWKALAHCWGDGIMPPWLLLALLAAGLAALPRVRWPALGLAGVFFLAQLLFPFAYAYQDYYFYSCALFVSAAFAYLFFGLLDSRLPRWLCWVLLAVPVVAQISTYYRNYRPGQLAPSDGGYSYTIALRDFLPKDTVIVVAGVDWSAVIPYYSQHKALMVRASLENDGAYLDRAFAELADEDVCALVLLGTQMNNHALVARAAAALDLDVDPAAFNSRAQIYPARRYRDSFKKKLRDVNNFGDMTNPPARPFDEPLKTFRLTPARAQKFLPQISPAPLQINFQFGWDYAVLDEKPIILAHPVAEVWLHAPSQSTQIEWDFGMLESAYVSAGPKTDGAEFTIIGLADGNEREIFRRWLDPVNRKSDRGMQRLSIPYQPIPGEILKFSTTPGPTPNFDSTYWARIEVK